MFKLSDYDLPTSVPGIVFNEQDREYYNNKSDLYLTEDDISFHGLKPYDQIPLPLPYPLPDNFFSAVCDSTKED